MQEQEYRVLARKYRPQNFKDLVGQTTLVQTITNSITQNRIAHAYLLTGVRGVGKTTTARLIAMSLNCENRSKDLAEPCSECNSCVTIREDRNMDVIEMDAASKTGVDDIREIIENVKYKPVSNKYKIFIIDEVHMLSKNAFNALLKTLEEPPAHVKFIFATTEVNKIPITIISRCQRFDLHRIEKEDLITHLETISAKEKIIINKDAIALIVRAADGSIRDGLSLLDQAISNEKESINSDTVIKMLGLANKDKIFDLMESIFRGEALKALEIYNKIYSNGADVVMIFDEMLNITHFITQLKIAPKLKEDIHIPELERVRGFEISNKISMSSLGMIWQVLFKGYEELQSGYHLFQHGEMIIIRLIYLYQGPTPDDLIKSSQGETFKEKELVSKNSLTESEKINSTINKNTDEISLSNLPNEKKIVNNSNTNIKINSFRNFVDLFYQKREAMLHTYLYNKVKLISFKEGEVVINAKSIPDSNFLRTIAKLISKWTGRIWQVTSSSSNIGQTLYEEDLVEQQAEIKKIKNDPEVREILDMFPGINVHSIINIKETTQEKNLLNKVKKTKET